MHVHGNIHQVPITFPNFIVTRGIDIHSAGVCFASNGIVLRTGHKNGGLRSESHWSQDPQSDKDAE